MADVSGPEHVKLQEAHRRLADERDAMKTRADSLGWYIDEAKAAAGASGRYTGQPLADFIREQAADNARLRKLITDAEWEGNTRPEPEPACPWCQTDRSLGPIGKPPGEHESDCPAFSAPGVVR